MKPLLRLIHWHTAEARALAHRIRALGYRVDARVPRGATVFREVRRQGPAGIVISLDRLPSTGRDVAFGLLGQKSTAAIPVVFAGGAPDKVAAIRARLPHARFAAWAAIGPALARMRAGPRPAADGPAGVMAAYAGTPLPQKLGISPGMRVALLGAPRDFAQTLGPLPHGARLTRRAAGAALAVWFVRRHTGFAAGLRRLADFAGRMPCWVVSPKKSGPLAADLSQNAIRKACLAAGLVDYKVCAVDAAWSGLLVRRRRDPGLARRPAEN